MVPKDPENVKFANAMYVETYLTNTQQITEPI